MFFLARSALVKYLMINWSILASKCWFFNLYSKTLLSSQSKVANYLIFQHHLLWAISKINTVQYSLLILSRFLLWIKMSMQQAFRDYFSTQYLYTFLFYWCLINHQMWLLNFTISSKLKRIVDLLWYYWEFNFNVDVGRREVAQTRFRLEMWENDSTWETRKLQSDCLATIQRIWLNCQRLECHLFLYPRCFRLICL